MIPLLGRAPRNPSPGESGQVTFLSVRVWPWLVLPFYMASVSCSDGAQERGGTEGPLAVGTIEMDAAYPVPFSYLTGVRELPDGSVLAADPLSQVLVRANLSTGAADTLGRVGAGPEEYRQPDHVLPFPGDSTLLVDLGNGRLTVLDSSGSFVRTLSMTQPSEDGGLNLLHPRFVDSRGRLYEVRGRSREAGPPDSAAVARIDPGTRQADTVA
ncbi:hypothetical protein ACFL3S_06765, partial [Gemmatimonadota bacterium]